MKKIWQTHSAVINLGSVTKLTLGRSGGGSEQGRYWGWDGMKNTKNLQKSPIKIRTLGTVSTLTLGRNGTWMESGRPTYYPTHI